MKKFKPCLSLFLALTMLCSVPSTTVSAVGSSRALNALAAEKTEQVVESVQVETAEGIRNDEIAEDELSAEESFKDEITEEETAHASTGDSSEAADAETAVESEIVVVGEDPEEANTEESEEAATEETAETVSEEQTKEVSIDVKAYALTGQQDGEDADAIAGEKSGEDSMDFLPDGIPVYSDAQDVTDYVRSKAIERMEEVIVCVPEEVFQQLIGMPVEYGFSEIFEHNGDPAAGDYLEHSLMSYYATARQLETGYSIVSYFFKYWETAEQCQAVNEAAAVLISSLGLKDNNKSDYDKVKAIYDYITSNVAYDHEAVTSTDPEVLGPAHSGYGAFVNHRCVCEGYAMMLYRLALEAGIDSRIITGIVMNYSTEERESHGWNIVKIGDVYYLLDATWDTGRNPYDYFLCGMRDFGHTNDDDQFKVVKGFSSTYPVSDYKYGFAPYGEAPEFSLITVDNKVVSNAAKNGRAKVLLFFDDKCVYSTRLLNYLADKELPGVDLIAADFGGKRTKSLIGSYFPASIPGVYTLYNVNNMNAMREMEKIAGIYDPATLSSPTIFLINAENQIVYAKQGSCDNAALFELIERLLVNPDAPPYQEDLEDYGNFLSIGLCGDNAIWRYYGNGTLRISGKGALWENMSSSMSGWYEDSEYYYFECPSPEQPYLKKEDVKRIVIEDGITGIARYIFYDMRNLISVEIPSSVTEINADYRHLFCRNDVVIYGYKNTEAKRYASEYGNPFVDLSTLSAPIDYYSDTSGSQSTIEPYLPAEEEPNVYALLTADKSVVLTKAENGRGKVFVLYDDNWGDDVPGYVFEALERTEILYADVLFVNCTYWVGTSDTLDNIGTIYPSDFRGNFCLANTNSKFYEYLKEKYGVDWPGVVIMDGDSNIVYAEKGIPEDLPDLVNSLVDHIGSSAGADTSADYGSFEKAGVCGKQAVWHYYSDGTLRISGKGNLWEGIYFPTPIGWVDSLMDGENSTVNCVVDYVFYSQIKRVIIDEGITYIGHGMFYDMNNLTYLEIPSSMVKIPADRWYHTLPNKELTIGGTFGSLAYQYARSKNLPFVDPSTILYSGADSVEVGKIIDLKAAGLGTLTYTSSDSKIATVNSKGIVKGIAKGTVTITIKASGDSRHPAVKKEIELRVLAVKPGKTTRGDMFNLANNVKVTWKEVPGAIYYKVYREGVTNPKETLKDPVIVTTGLVGWDKSPGLTNGNAYRYKIVASLTGKGDASGDSRLSYSKVMYRLKTVVIRSVKNTAPGKVTVKYDKTTAGDSYVLQYCERQDMVGAKTKVVLGANNTSYVISGLTKGKTYYISIRVRKKVNGIDYYTTFGVPKKVKIEK